MCQTCVHARVNTDTNMCSCLYIMCSCVICAVLLNVCDQYINNFDMIKNTHLIC
jgi:hypothetical protein